MKPLPAPAPPACPGSDDTKREVLNVKQLSMIDAFMLAAESDRQKLQMATLSVLAPPAKRQRRVSPQVVRDLVARRLHLAPALCRKLVRVPLDLDHPYWVEDADIDLDHHVRSATLPAPGDDRQLADAVARLVTEPLDHARPLWELHVIDGLAGGRVALLLKLHHAAVDGVSALDLHAALFDHSPSGRQVPRPIRPLGEPVPSGWEMLARGVVSLPRQPIRAVLGGAGSLPYLDHLMPFRVTPGIGTLAGAVRRLRGLPQPGADGGVLEGAGLRAPKTVLDRPLTSPRRRLAFARSSVDDAKQVKTYFGVSLNDVIVATMAGAVRAWLLDLGDLPEEPLIALIPVSVRTDNAESGGNLVQVMFIELPTHEPDPEQRLKRTHEALRAAKERHRAVPAAAMQGADSLLMPVLFVRASRAAALLAGVKGASANIMISNVPGPTAPMYIAGTRVEALYPVGGPLDGFGFCTVAFSYNGSFDIGFAVAEDSPADPWRLADAYERSHRELAALVPARRGP
jgi:diacylglycerol O-acyltransferase